MLTVFAFSSENWNRPADEVSGLMDLFAMALVREVPQLQADGVQLHFVGERSGLSQKVAHGIEQAELATASNSRLILNICFNYGAAGTLFRLRQSWRLKVGPSLNEP